MQQGTAQRRDMDPLSSLNNHWCFVEHIILGFSLMHVLCKVSSPTIQTSTIQVVQINTKQISS